MRRHVVGAERQRIKDAARGAGDHDFEISAQDRPVRLEQQPVDHTDRVGEAVSDTACVQ
jgi:hypothetical protein